MDSKVTPQDLFPVRCPKCQLQMERRTTMVLGGSDAQKEMWECPGKHAMHVKVFKAKRFAPLVTLATQSDVTELFLNEPDPTLCLICLEKLKPQETEHCGTCLDACGHWLH